MIAWHEQRFCKSVNLSSLGSKVHERHLSPWVIKAVAISPFYCTQREKSVNTVHNTIQYTILLSETDYFKL